MRPVEVGSDVTHLLFLEHRGTVLSIHPKFGIEVLWCHQKSSMRHPLSQIISIEDVPVIPKKKRNRKRKEVIDDEIDEEIETAEEPQYRSRFEGEIEETQESEEQDGDAVEEAELSDPLPESEDDLEYTECET